MSDNNKEPISIHPVGFEPIKKKQPAVRIAPGYRRWLVVIALGLFACISGYLLLAKSIYITPVPQQAEIHIDTLLQFKIGQRYLIPPGEYNVQLHAQGYHPLQDTLTVNAKDSQQTFTYSLKKLPGHLKVILNPALKAELFIDAETKGTVPATISNIEPGAHIVRIIANRYLPYQQQIAIEGRNQEQTLEPELQPAWATVSIQSEPAGAELQVDEQPIGTTPLSTEILQGRHELRLRLDSYTPWQKAVNLSAGEHIELHDVKLKPAEAVVTINSKPNQANVTVNEQYQGQTPIQIAAQPGQSIAIRLFKQGYRRASRTLRLNAGDKKTISLTLETELTPVQFKVFPAKAELFIDGQSHGTANQTLALSTQPHKIEIRSPGFLDYSATITPRKGVAQTVNTKLKSVQTAKQEAIKPLIQTAAGQKLKLFHPKHEFSMGASRREPGRRANETIRRVKLTRSFYLSVNEVTNAQYRLFEKAHTSGTPRHQSLNGENNPVVTVSWDQAAVYCNWLSAQANLKPVYTLKSGKITGYDSRANGYRLPTESEWAWAARYTGPNEMLKFPWGTGFPPKQVVGNFADQSAASIIATVISGYNDGFAATAPVGSFGLNSKRLAGLAGNVSEWMHDYYAVSVAGENALADFMGAAQGQHHVIRGSSWRHGTVSELRLSYRDYGNDGRDDLGFRIARYLE